MYIYIRIYIVYGLHY